MQTYFPGYVDRALQLPAYWADCEAHMGNDFGKARAVWEAALKLHLGR